MDFAEPDVVVVGLGPAGARAAAAAAAAGLDVLAIDRRRRPGVPVQCAEFVPMMIAREVEGVGAATTQLIRRMLTVVDHGKPEETPNCPGRIIDRARFDGMLAQEAARAGAAAGLTHPVTGAGIAAAVQSGTLAGRAAVEWFGGRRSALDAYEQELGDVFDVALARARRRRHETLTCYRTGTRPDAHALRVGWISSPRYWAT